jgi:NADH-quinone oxidoreductase subunit C
MAESEGMVRAVAEVIGDGLLGVDTDKGGAPILVVDRRVIQEACRLLRDGDAKYVHLSGVWGVDYLGMGLEPRFAVVYYLYSPTLRSRIALKVPLEEADPVVPSVVGIFPTANWHERETFDMYGIRFEGHPNLTRILMPDDATFYPLRKDVPLGGEEVEFTHNSGRLRRQRESEPPEVSRN